MNLEGTQFGHYRLIRLIGSGGMGEVYLAEDTRIARNVAIKVVRNEPDPYPNASTTKEAVRLFEREMKAITALDHPNILPLLDFGEEILNKTVFTYMVMPFRAEGSLVDWLHQQNSGDILSSHGVIHIVLQAAAALQHAHNHHLMHLDVKPSNFLIRQLDEHLRLPDVLLTDFGIAKFNTTTATISQSIRGTPAYMAPEQWSGTPVPATDQYALAIMAYQLLTGKSAFQGSMQQVMYQHLQASPQPPSAFNSRIPPAVDNVILRALAKKTENRFPSIQTFAEAFEHAWSDETATAWSQLPPTQYNSPGPSLSPGNATSLPRTQFAHSIVQRSSRKVGFPRFALFLSLIILIIGGSFAFALSNHSSPGNNSTSSSISNSSSVTPTPAAIATSAPTSTPTSSPSPAPTPLPTSKPGDMLYQADQSWSGWNGTSDWKVNSGLLLNDGTYADYNARATIVAPYQPQTPDYTEEMQMQVVRPFTTGTIYPCLYMTTRGNGLSNGWQGYAASICANAGNGTPVVQLIAIDSSNNVFTILSTTPFDPKNAWHRYHFEIKGTTLKLLVDGGLLLSADDSRYLNAGQMGLLSNYMQVKISSFKIAAL